MNYITVTLSDGRFMEFWVSDEEIDATLETLNENCTIRSE